MTPATGERLIALYKTVKGVLQLTLGATLFVLVVSGRTEGLPDALVRLGHAMSRAWAADLAAKLARIATRGHLELTAVALAIDAVVALIEGWALWRGHWWGRWVVVVATGGLIPFEIVSMARHHRVLDFAAFVINVAIVAYLARHAWRHHVERMMRKPAAL